MGTPLFSNQEVLHRRRHRRQVGRTNGSKPDSRCTPADPDRPPHAPPRPPIAPQSKPRPGPPARVAREGEGGLQERDTLVDHEFHQLVGKLEMSRVLKQSATGVIGARARRWGGITCSFHQTQSGAQIRRFDLDQRVVLASNARKVLPAASRPHGARRNLRFGVFGGGVCVHLQYCVVGSIWKLDLS